MKLRTNEVRNAMLLWLYLHGDRQPSPEEFGRRRKATWQERRSRQKRRSLLSEILLLIR
jgi:hypothetical protein